MIETCELIAHDVTHIFCSCSKLHRSIWDTLCH